jgi:hypothetical protein
MQDAPLVVVPLAHKATYLERYAEADKGWQDRMEARWPVPYWYIDTGMAALMMLLTAVDEGLGACFFGIMPVPGEGFEPEVAVPAYQRFPGGVRDTAGLCPDRRDHRWLPRAGHPAAESTCRRTQARSRRSHPLRTMGSTLTADGDPLFTPIWRSSNAGPHGKYLP